MKLNKQDKEEIIMAALATLGEVTQKVDEMSKNCFDETIPAKDISFEDLGLVKIAGKTHPMREMAQRSFCYRLGTPFQYLMKCPPEVQAYNMNHWMPQEKNDELFLRFDGDDVRAMFTTKYKPIDNFEVLERIYSLGYNDKTNVQYSLDGDFMSLSILDGEKAFSIQKEKFHPGISFGNSEVGLASLSISAFIMRLVCTNGMISKTDLSKSIKHVSGKVLDKFPEILEGVASELTFNKEQFKHSLASTVDDPELTFSSFNRQFQLNEPERDAVTWAWPYEQGNTMFNIVNTYTKASQFEELPAASSFKLQKAGGQILSMVRAS
jgi:hypothetical protein